MKKEFPKTREEIHDLGIQLIKHLRDNLADTSRRAEWSERNFDALRSFKPSGYVLQRYPDEGTKKGAFLWDYVAYQQDSGILIAAESEWQRNAGDLRADFEKLLYVRSPLKVFMFWSQKEESEYEGVIEMLRVHMNQCEEYSPAEMFIVYCRTWTDDVSNNDDHVWWLQIDGDPAHRSVGEQRFQLFTPEQ